MNENKQKEAVENLEYCDCGTMVSRVGVSLTRGTQFESGGRQKFIGNMLPTVNC